MTAAPFDPLWVPLLTHYHGSPPTFDAAATAAQIARISPYVQQFLVAGTTGDGWAMSEDNLDAWLAFIARSGALTAEHSVLVGAFGATTKAVIARAQRIEATLAKAEMKERFAGLTLCAPVDPTATQEVILGHFREILANTTAPIAIYQLPQVVGCRIAPETLQSLSQDTDRITLFKDTSGEDHVIQSGLDFGAIRFLRGAEGDYFEHFKGYGGLYDGFLLSTANALAQWLRRIMDATDQAMAKALSMELSSQVAMIFEAAADTENPFAEANRALDHVASGSERTPLSATGVPMPKQLQSAARSILDKLGNR